jgi:hypothetical protein
LLQCGTTGKNYVYNCNTKAGPILLLIGPYLGALPVYSADFNSIEFMWVYVKSVLRKLKARVEEDLIDTAVQALDCVTPAHCLLV